METVKIKTGSIPVLFVEGDNLPQAWEAALLAVWDHGIEVHTEFDRKDRSGNFIDPPSRDATVTIVVRDPLAEPRIHQNFPCGFEELEVYRQEVVDGIHDHWIDPKDGKWTYTYHKRLYDYLVTDDLFEGTQLYKVLNGDLVPLRPVNQIEALIRKAAEIPYSRRTQAITWMPTADPQTEDPPCLQRIWIRLLTDEDGHHVLNMNTHWRSRDLYKAWFMNVYAITDLQRVIAEEISRRLDKPVRPGRYVDISDSLHIYGSYFPDVEVDIRRMKAEPDYRQRTWESTSEVFQEMTREAREKLRNDPDYMLGVSRGPG